MRKTFVISFLFEQQCSERSEHNFCSCWQEKLCQVQNNSEEKQCENLFYFLKFYSTITSLQIESYSITLLANSSAIAITLDKPKRVVRIWVNSHTVTDALTTSESASSRVRVAHSKVGSSKVGSSKIGSSKIAAGLGSRLGSGLSLLLLESTTT